MSTSRAGEGVPEGTTALHYAGRHWVAAEQYEDVCDALRDLIKCHGMPPSKDCGFLNRAKEVLGEF